MAITASDVRCESGVVLRQGATYYLTVPASCFGTDDGTAADGCQEAQLPPGWRVTIRGARHNGHVAYSSFSAMQLRGGKREHACAGNDLGLVRLDRRDVHRVSVAVPGIGHPTGVSHRAPSSGARLRTYVNGAPSDAAAGSTSDGGWHQAVTIAAAVTKENRGAPLLTGNRQVVGLESLVPASPTSRLMTSNTESTLSSLARELHFMRRVRGFHHVHLVTHNPA